MIDELNYRFRRYKFHVEKPQSQGDIKLSKKDVKRFNNREIDRLKGELDLREDDDIATLRTALHRKAGC